MLVLSSGALGVFDGGESSNRTGVGYRFGEHTDWKLIPSLGAAWSDEGAYFLSTEVRRNLWLADRVVVTPSFGLGYFEKGNILDLGGDLEFRSGLELTYCFERDWRVGVAFFHLSNAGIFSSNPGTEALVLTLAVPLTK